MIFLLPSLQQAMSFTLADDLGLSSHVSSKERSLRAREEEAVAASDKERQKKDGYAYIPLSEKDPIERYLQKQAKRLASDRKRRRREGGGDDGSSDTKVSSKEWVCIDRYKSPTTTMMMIALLYLQYIVFVPDEGLGNRLRGATSTFLLAMLLDRPFLLHWTKYV